MIRTSTGCWCTKVGAFLYPLTCARAVVAMPAATLSRAEEGKVRSHQGSAQTRGVKNKGARRITPARALSGGLHSPGKAKGVKNKGARRISPGKSLVERPTQPRQGPCRGNLPKHQPSRHP